MLAKSPDQKIAKRIIRFYLCDCGSSLDISGGGHVYCKHDPLGHKEIRKKNGEKLHRITTLQQETSND